MVAGNHLLADVCLIEVSAEATRRLQRQWIEIGD
jgi:hypothetical protein